MQPGATRTRLPLPSPPRLEPPVGFAARLVDLTLPVDAGQLASAGDFLALLLAMNAHLNLTSITDPAEAWTRHVLDAWTLLPELAGLPPGRRVLDLGSGGGVPGIPLAIARPDLRFTLVDATSKKAAFLEDAAKALGLSNVAVVADRAESLAKTSLAGSFDVVTARAVAKLDALLPWVAPFARGGGRLLLIKGERADAELTAAKRALSRCKLAHERTVVTPTGRIVVLRRS